jgi:hypothetical protein
MSNENCERVVEWCNKYIEEFERCGLKQEVLKRIFELVQWLEEQKTEGKQVGEFKIIFYDIERAVEMAKALSKKYRNSECEYYRRWLSLHFTEEGGLGHWTTMMRQ